MDAQSGRSEAEVLFCPSCGQHLAAANVYCPRCGRPVSPSAPPTSGAGAYSATTPWDGPAPPPAALPGAPVAGPHSATWLGAPSAGPSSPASPASPAEFGQPGPALPPYANPQPGPAAPYGYTGPTYTTPTVLGASSVPAPRKRRIGCMVGSISVVLVVALLLAGALVMYNVLANSDVVAAKYVPANTVVYASVDLAAMALNQHGVNPNTMSQSSVQSKQFQQATCLDYQTDVKPWLGRDIAFAVFPRPAPHATGSDSFVSDPARNLGYAALFQSHDQSATQAAVRQSIVCQQQRGSTVSQSVYGGLTIYTLTSVPGGGTTGALVAGDGWAVLASDASAAQVIVDRLGGKGDTLAASSTFVEATRGMPANRFGTLFVNLHQLMAVVSSASNQALDVPFADLYPTAAGYLAWTAPGGRAQLTLKAARPLGLATLSGDTTGLASLVPGDALAYAGVANLGGALQAEQKFASANGASPDLFDTLFGVPATDPALQQPSALAVLRGGLAQTGGAPEQTAQRPVFLLRAPDPSAAMRLLQTAATMAKWTLKPMTVAGQPATAIYAMGESFLGGSPPVPPTDAPFPTPIPPEHLTGVAAQVGSAFVVAGSADDLSTIIQTARGGSSLAQNSTFSRLVAQAPGGAASTSYLDLAGFQSMMGPAAAATATAAAGSGPQTTALLLTTVWNDQVAQVTLDAKLDR